MRTTHLALLALGAGLCCATAGRAAGEGPAAVAARVERLIDARLAQEKIPASPPAGDGEFLRRASLDLVGRIPTSRRVVEFLADRRPDKRARLIDELLADEAFGRNLGEVWYHLLVSPNDDNFRLLDHSLAGWLAARFNRNQGWDRVVSDLLTARGARDANPAAEFWLAQVGAGKKAPRVKPADAAGVIAQRFLGVRYQCAECHNHPFTEFTQADFWSLAAFFGKVGLAGANRKAAKAKAGAARVQDEFATDLRIVIPESKGKQAAPRFPDGTAYKPSGKGLRADFAAWCTSPDNRAFAEAGVNRLWAHLFGRGLYPVDDFRADAPPSHPEVLRLLAKEFVRSGFDMKHLVRCLCQTRAYQRSSDAAAGNAADEKFFSHASVRLMSTDVLLDSLSTALGQNALGGKKGKAKNAKNARNPRAKFLALFATSEERDFSVEYSHGIPQALRLMNGDHLGGNNPTLKGLLRAGDPDKVVEGLFLATLSRRPTPAERQKATELVRQEGGLAKGAAALQWVLLNSGEFVLNH
jgi:hypothetical protein